MDLNVLPIGDLMIIWDCRLRCQNRDCPRKTGQLHKRVWREHSVGGKPTSSRNRVRQPFFQQPRAQISRLQGPGTPSSIPPAPHSQYSTCYTTSQNLAWVSEALLTVAVMGACVWVSITTLTDIVPIYYTLTEVQWLLVSHYHCTITLSYKLSFLASECVIG